MSLFCWTQRKIFWRMWETEQFWGTFDFHCICSYYGSKWGPKTAWLQTFFRISSVVFSRTKKFIQVWNYLRVSKWWHNFYFRVKSPLRSMWEVGAKERPQLTGIVNLHVRHMRPFWLCFSLSVSLWSSRKTQKNSWGTEQFSKHRVKGEPLLSLSLSLLSSFLFPSVSFELCFSVVWTAVQHFVKLWSLRRALSRRVSPVSKCLWKKDALGPCFNIGELEMDCWCSV